MIYFKDIDGNELEIIDNSVIYISDKTIVRANTRVYIGCEHCSNEVSYVNTNVFRAAWAKGEERAKCCTKCKTDFRYLPPEEALRSKLARLEKSVLTKTKNGSRTQDLIAKGLKWGFANLDQTTGSAVREKINLTKERNGTADQTTGSTVRDKMNTTKERNGTLVTGCFAWNGNKRREMNTLCRPGFLSWTIEQRNDHNKKIAIMMLNDIDENGENAYHRSNKIRIEKLIKAGKILSNATAYKLYCIAVNKYTRRNDLTILENYELRGRSNVDSAYHLDHRISKKFGYLNNIHPKIIGNIHNLEFIPAIDNCIKQANCSLDLYELLNKIYELALTSDKGLSDLTENIKKEVYHGISY